MIRFAVEPEQEIGSEDGRGPDTVNRILLHGARHHDREALFWQWAAEGQQAGLPGLNARSGGWLPTPDWRADRASIRVALTLHARLDLVAGDRVAIWLPLGPEFAVIERGAWMFGGTSVPLDDSASPPDVGDALLEARPAVLFASSREAVAELRKAGRYPDSIQAAIVLEREEFEDDHMLPFSKFLEYGGVLDTPERASMLRTAARAVQPSDPAVLEIPIGEGEAEPVLLSQAAFLSAAEAVEEGRRPVPGPVVIDERRPFRTERARVYATWAAGIGSVVYAANEEARAHLGELSAGSKAGAGSISS